MLVEVCHGCCDRELVESTLDASKFGYRIKTCKMISCGSNSCDIARCERQLSYTFLSGLESAIVVCEAELKSASLSPEYMLTNFDPYAERIRGMS